MVFRVRTRSVNGAVNGSAKRWINGVLRVDNRSNTPWISDYGRCEDTIDGTRRAHPLLIEQFSVKPSPLSGSLTTSPGNTRTYDSFLPSSLIEPAGHATLSTLPSESADMATLMARTNPGRSETSIPLIAAEMRDLPNMIRQRGLRLIGDEKRRPRYQPGQDARDDAGEYLAQQFGWRPLINDLNALMQFELSTERRFGELRRLYSKRGLKRRITLSTEVKSEIVDDDYTISSVLGVAVRVKVLRTTKRRRWGTIRWYPSDPMPQESDEVVRRRAHRLVFGINGVSPQNAVDAWNALPWSWLVDWFSNTGDFIQSYSNAIPVYADSKCIMTETETVVNYIRIPDSANWVSGGDSTKTRSTKMRYVGGPLPAITMPILTSRQWSILGALSITRLR